MQIENITLRTKRMIDDLKTICNTILFDPMFHGESFTKLSAEYSPVIDSIING